MDHQRGEKNDQGSCGYPWILVWWAGWFAGMSYIPIWMPLRMKKENDE